MRRMGSATASSQRRRIDTALREKPGIGRGLSLVVASDRSKRENRGTNKHWYSTNHSRFVWAVLPLRTNQTLRFRECARLFFVIRELLFKAPSNRFVISGPR